MALIPKISIPRTYGEKDSGITPRLPAQSDGLDKDADKPVPAPVAKRGRLSKADQNIGVKLS